MVEFELAGADLVSDPPFGRGCGEAGQGGILGDVGGLGRIEGMAVEKVDEMFQYERQLGVLVETDGYDGPLAGGGVGRADVGETLGHFDENVLV